MEEVWKPISDFPGYSVSDEGRVRNDESGRIMAVRVNQNGVAYVGMTRNFVQLTRGLALLVAEAFIPHRAMLDVPINRDGDRLNCRADNLEWRNHWFAMQYFKQVKKIDRNHCPVQDLDSGRLYISPLEAARENGLLEEQIVRAIHNVERTPYTNQAFDFV
jgi:hypothetical protein